MVVICTGVMKKKLSVAAQDINRHHADRVILRTARELGVAT